MSYEIRRATADDIEAIRVLLPRLGSFQLPARRSPEDLWRGDEEMLLRWAEGLEPTLYAWLAVMDDSVAGTRGHSSAGGALES